MNVSWCDAECVNICAFVVNAEPVRAEGVHVTAYSLGHAWGHALFDAQVLDPLFHLKNKRSLQKLYSGDTVGI